MEYIKYRGFDHLWAYSGPWLWWLVLLYLSLPFLAYIFFPFIFGKGIISRSKKTVCLFVLGDIGHSPRMCYHARSFAKHDYYVNLCGYVESEPPQDIYDNMNVEIYPIEAIKNTYDLPFLVFACQKVIGQCFQLFAQLFEFRGADYILIQNPPSLPILLLAIIQVKLFSRNTKLIIDWHNLNYSVLNLKYNNMEHPLVKILKAYEKYLGRFADYNLTVTDKMRSFLIEEFGISQKSVISLHDRPTVDFLPLEKHQIVKEEILLKYNIIESINDITDHKIVLSSTSFTPDEDFSLLLAALHEYDQNVKQTKLPKLLVIITGKGPLRQKFLEDVKRMQFVNVTVKNVWLPSDAYPLVVSTADISISLHTSSSGIDLPMKVVDFFGCGIPVISLDFLAINELVKDGINGIIVRQTEKKSLGDSICDALITLLTDQTIYEKVKSGAMSESSDRWDQCWDRKLGKIFKYKETERYKLSK